MAYSSTNRSKRTYDTQGKLHSVDDEPARIGIELDFASSNEFITKEWFYHGVRHRESGPAYTRRDNHVEWWIHGARHNPTGPAIIRVDGTGTFYIWDEEYTPEKIKEVCGAQVTTKPPYFESNQEKMIWLAYVATLQQEIDVNHLITEILAKEICAEIDREIIETVRGLSKSQHQTQLPEQYVRTAHSVIDLS